MQLAKDVGEFKQPCGLYFFCKTIYLNTQEHVYFMKEQLRLSAARESFVSFQEQVSMNEFMLAVRILCLELTS
jgi:hypothetical protein